MACLLCLSLLICSEACADPSVEFPDGPLDPLPARHYPGVNGLPSIVRIQSHLTCLRRGGLGGLSLDISKDLVWRRRKVATEVPEGGAARFM